MRQRWKPQQLQFIFNPGRLVTNGIITGVISCPNRDTGSGKGYSREEEGCEEETWSHE